MKKKWIVACALMTFVMMTGCAKQEVQEEVQEEAQEEAQEEVQEEVQNPEDAVVEEEILEENGQEAVIMPLPVTMDVNHMSDCMAAISLSDKDAFSEDNGKVQMKVTVWTYDLYDMVDISMLEEGSFIQIRDEKVEVSSLEVSDKGVLINGGLDNGGYELRTSEESVYYEIGYSDRLAYYELGEIVLPVAADFTFIDSSDLDKGEVSYSVEDLRSNEEIIYHFTPDNTRIVVEGGEVVVMERVYIP